MAVCLESSLVDDDLVVEPAERDQIRGVGTSTFRPGHQVMDLEPVSAIAAVGSAHNAVAVDDGPAQGGRNGARLPPVSHRGAVFGAASHFCDRITEDRFQSLPADPGPSFQDDTGPPVAGRRMRGVDEHGELGGRRIFGDEEFGQGDRLAP
jgi:hypothetical protein